MMAFLSISLLLQPRLQLHDGFPFSFSGYFRQTLQIGSKRQTTAFSESFVPSLPTINVIRESKPSRNPKTWATLGSSQKTPEGNDSQEVSERWKDYAPKVQRILDSIKWNESGLAVAIAQHANTGAILMQAFVNPNAVATTLISGRATFYSRSRSALWTKGETSSNFIHVKDVFVDCDRDSIIYLGLPDGPTCHTGAETCYYTPLLNLSMQNQDTTDKQALTTLYSLEHTVRKRKEDLFIHEANVKPSWTQKLLQDETLLCSKIREEADELSRTIENNEGKNRTASEMADVLYHCMVLLAVQDVKMEEVLEVLRARFDRSGIEEKNSRK